MSADARKWILFALGIVLLVVIGLVARNRIPEIQAPATFARIQQAIEGSDAAGVVAELHPRYDFAAEWPAHFGAEGAGTLGSDTDARTLAKRGIAVVFLQRGENHLHFSYRIARVAPQTDGTVLVDATIEVGSPNGGGRMVAPVEHHWVLAPDGWLLGRLRILSHDHIDIAL